jgi:DNA-binding MarR family transcriptional regulator
MPQSLGTSLRLLIEALDSAVDDAYRTSGVPFRARFYPYFQLLIDDDDLSVGEFAARLGFSQPAVTQSLGLMSNAGLIERIPVADRRERRYRLTGRARAMLPSLQRIWDSVAGAASRLDRSLPAPLSETVTRALHELSQTPFTQMIAEELRRADDASSPDYGNAHLVEGRADPEANRSR